MKKEATVKSKATLTLIPSDYIMSSLDIAKVLHQDPKEVYELIEEYIGLGTFDKKGYLYPVSVKVNGVATNVYLMDLEAVLALAEDISADSGQDEGQVLLINYFELARTAKILSSEIFMETWTKIKLRLLETEAFAKRVMACIEAND